MLQLAKPIDVSAGILGRARALPRRLSKSYTRRKALHSITVPIKKRNCRDGCISHESVTPQSRSASADKLLEGPQKQQNLQSLKPPRQSQLQPKCQSPLGLQSRPHRLNCHASNSMLSDSADWNHKNRIADKQNELRQTRPIIKKRCQTVTDELMPQNSHNAIPPVETAVKQDTGPTIHQQRVQQMFENLRFSPQDTFYKKVVFAPDKVKQMFAAPRFSRGCGSPMLYDIASQNGKHHRDVNFDFNRDSLRKICSNFHRTSKFRNGY